MKISKNTFNLKEKIFNKDFLSLLSTGTFYVLSLTGIAGLCDTKPGSLEFLGAGMLVLLSSTVLLANENLDKILSYISKIVHKNKKIITPQI